MRCNVLLFITFGLDYFYVNAADYTQNRQNSQIDEDNPPAWYHLPNQGQQPPALPILPPDQSPYGPRISNKPDSSFVPIPSPFQLPKPKTPQELAASQIVNAAQERRQKDFFDREADYDDGFDFGQDSDDHQLYWKHHQATRRRKPSHKTSTESPLKMILSREITNLERYLPLLARKIGNNHTLNGVIQPQNRHKAATPIFLPSPTHTTRLGKRRKLITTTPITTTEFPNKKHKTKCHNCNDEDKEKYIDDITTIVPITRRRKLQKTTQPCRSRKLKSTTRYPLPTLEIIGTPSTTTLIPFIDYTEIPPSSTRWPHKTFAKWTKFTLSSRRIETLRPLLFWTTTRMPRISTIEVIEKTLPFITTTQASVLKRVLGIGDRNSRPWTHREHKAEVGCPNGEVSPIEMAIVWFVDHLRHKTTASTELIEAVKDALSRFRSTLTHNRAASHPSDSSVGSELESTWNELKKGTWIERVFAELAFSDSTGHHPNTDGPDAEAAARKVDELWREAMLASALSAVQNSDVEKQPQERRTPLFHDQINDPTTRLYDSPKTVETALNCDTFPMLCSILQTLKNNDQNTTILPGGSFFETDHSTATPTLQFF